jgi:neutral amino acid transport system ATP-binding protein
MPDDMTVPSDRPADMPSDTNTGTRTDERADAQGPKSSAADQAREALSTAPAEPGGKKPDPILTADHVVRTFGGLKAVDVAHVEIQRGSITALIGPNGAGKTTFFNLLTGFDKPDEGEWEFNGQSLSGVPAYRVARQGMVRTFQLTKALSRLTVLENVRLGATGQRGERLFTSILPWLWKNQEQEITARGDALLERFNLTRVRDDFAGSLSGGQRKLLEMARALMVNPEMVMLDEPMAGVNPRLRQSLNEHIRGLREDGTTVLFVEHDMDVVRDVSDWVIVMAQGEIVAEGTPDTVMQNPAVIDAYLGAHHDAPLDLEEEEQQLREVEEQLDHDDTTEAR